MLVRFILLFSVFCLFSCKSDVIESKGNTNQIKEKAKQTKDEAVSKSVYKDEPCDVLIKNYKKAIDLLKADKNSSEGKELYKSLRNDPIMSQCRSIQEHKIEFKELDKLFHNRKK